ncbi:DENN domain-containing protein 1A isoform X7 [Drosophila nasuta]|uniref:DENN domain-containing protein 1A isoform X7 n=1 Tax=Drosophila albomicans TaxID=7291 RepID=A0A6P8WF49_DROAB|nr:DENN domain-containing protein 1A isoform X7 [Drosophila albomicans]XP_060652115.1 DENN domain-containing protein 1A isoform X7 [Drosophila nasuta]
MGSRIKNDVKKLFEFWCEVKPTRGIDRGTISRNGGGTATPAGVIIESFPEGFRDKEVLTGIPSFAFPCDIERGSVQSYSFVHTTGDSKWRFGFCRHDPKTDTAMVLITYLPWHDTFLKLLIVLAELRRTDRNGFRTFLSEAYNRGVPDSGGSLTVFYSSGQSHFTFERPLQFQLPSIPENHNLNLYYNFVDPKEMICVFAAMLAERRIIFTSSHLDRLSSCIQAANAFLYPMVWQHIFIPVLPWEFKDYLGAPMPYLIGVPKPVLDTVSDDELGEVVILNCDTKIFESPFDDVRSLPPEIVSQLKKYLSHTQDHIGDRVSKIFLGALVQLIGGYRDAVEFHDTCKTFNHAKFIESRPAHLRPFLTKMMELQIFAQFVDDRLKMLNSGLGFSDEFELETVRYAEKMKKRGRNYVFLKQMKDKSPRSNSSAQPQPEDSMNDLISLDDSNNTSFDLEDFDPLNQNARPLPPLGSKHFNSNKTKSSTLPAGVTSSVVMQANNSVNNPLYPYFAPKHMATVAAVTNRVTPLPPQIQRNNMTGVKPDDDFELLRKYGLDQFSLNVTTTTTTPSNTTTPALTAGAGVGKGMNNWTTFD